MMYGVWQVYEKLDVSEKVVHRGTFEKLTVAQTFVEDHARQQAGEKYSQGWIDWDRHRERLDIPIFHIVGMLNRGATSSFHIVFSPIR